MIKVHIDRIKNKYKVLAKGTAMDMTLEAAMAIKLTYQAICKENPESANQFKNKLIGLLLDPSSPVWKEG